MAANRSVLVLVALAGLTGCFFDRSGVSPPAADISPNEPRPHDGPTPGDGDGDGPPVDLLLPDVEPACPPGTTYCEDGVQQTCNQTGTGPDPALAVSCSFVCAAGSCAQASNLPATAYAACDHTAPALTPPSGANVTLDDPALPRITCSPHCGDGTTTTITTSAAGSGLAWVCLASLALPTDVTLEVSGTVDEALILFVDGAVTVDGTIELDAQSATASAEGIGGPGGGAGGGFTASAGKAGSGPCPGQGGTQAGTSNDYAAGAGGGGGGGGKGGDGGDGRNPNDDDVGAGGAGGTACTGPELIPLAGGSGGGSGADGTCGGDCGWPGGGGGGAIQISSRTSITISGTVSARGGGGHGKTSGGGTGGGGGGGGSGGGILLEAPLVAVTGALVVDGGDGGPSGAGAGGKGASGTTLDGAKGASYGGAGQGGSGGGGGGGRIRLNSATPVQCGGFASPVPACSSGALRAGP